MVFLVCAACQDRSDSSPRIMTALFSQKRVATSTEGRRSAYDRASIFEQSITDSEKEYHKAFGAIIPMPPAGAEPEAPIRDPTSKETLTVGGQLTASRHRRTPPVSQKPGAAHCQ